MKNSTTPVLVKPLFRGHSHQAAFFFALGACSMLSFEAHGTREFTSVLIYSISLVALFGISALYHRLTWKPEQRIWMKRLDHAAIYLLIAGTFTPICLLALPLTDGYKLLQFVWTAAFFGFFQSLFWVSAPKWISSILYVALGCFIIPYLSDLKTALSLQDIGLVLTGGFCYITGAIIYALKRPNPNPKFFGYHEIFHLLVIAGAIFHFMLIVKLIK